MSNFYDNEPDSMANKLWEGHQELMKENQELKEALKNTVVAWEKLPGSKNYTVREVSNWLSHDMKPAIDNLREIIK